MQAVLYAASMPCYGVWPDMPGRNPEQAHSCCTHAVLVLCKMLPCRAVLWHAGRVIHLKPVGTQMAGRWRQQKRRLYRAVWIDAKSVQEEGILISGGWCLGLKRFDGFSGTRSMCSVVWWERMPRVLRRRELSS